MTEWLENLFRCFFQTEFLKTAIFIPSSSHTYQTCNQILIELQIALAKYQDEDCNLAKFCLHL